MMNLINDEFFLGLFVAIFSSGGFWAYMQFMMEKKSKRTRALMGIMHYQILYYGSKYINRGHISKDEYDDLISYLYEPYKDLGGNGSSEYVISKLNQLPNKPTHERTNHENSSV